MLSFELYECSFQPSSSLCVGLSTDNMEGFKKLYLTKFPLLYNCTKVQSSRWSVLFCIWSPGTHPVLASHLEQTAPLAMPLLLTITYWLTFTNLSLWCAAALECLVYFRLPHWIPTDIGSRPHSRILCNMQTCHRCLMWKEFPQLQSLESTDNLGLQTLQSLGTMETGRNCSKNARDRVLKI